VRQLHTYRKRAAKKAVKKAVKRAVRKSVVKKAMRRVLAKKKPVVKKAVKGKVIAKKAIIMRAKPGKFVIRYKENDMTKDLTVNDAEYLRDYTLLVTFSDGKKVEVDFAEFINDNKIAYLSKYKSLNNFMKFKVDGGNVVWGRNWDLIFPVDQLYSGRVSV
jgi:hypothetical protein